MLSHSMKRIASRVTSQKGSGGDGTGVIGESDVDFNQTTLLIGTTGNIDGSQSNNTFVDRSTLQIAQINKIGTCAQGSFNPFSLPSGYWGSYFDGNSSLSYNNTLNDDVYSNNFCIEFWVNPDNSSSYTSSNQCIYANGWPIQVGLINGQFVATVKNGVNAADPNIFPGGSLFGGSVTPSKWTHCAFTRESRIYRLYVNGILTASYEAPLGSGPVRSTSAKSIIGNSVFVNAPFKGYISNFRIINGLATYTSPFFSPSKIPLDVAPSTVLLTCNQNRIVNLNSYSRSKIQNNRVLSVPFGPFASPKEYVAETDSGSVYFDGSVDYLTKSFSGGGITGDFSIEFWAYPLNTGTTQMWFNNGLGIQIYLQDSHWNIAMSSSNSYSYFALYAITECRFGEWQYVVLSKSGMDYYGYVNGNGGKITTTTERPNVGANEPFRLGSFGNTLSAKGFMSDVRVSLGVNLYDPQKETIPLKKLDNISPSSTYLLCNFNNASIVDLTAKNNIELFGNVRVSLTAYKFGNSSIYFDGLGDYLTIRDDTVLGRIYHSINYFSPFTIELWCYRLGNSYVNTTYDTIFGSPSSSLGFSVFGLYVSRSTRQIFLFINGVGYASSFTIESVKWVHIAISKINDKRIKVFVDGNLALDVNIADQPILYGMHFGWDRVSSNGYFLGNMDEIRISQGVARYVSNFKVPTKEFPRK